MIIIRKSFSSSPTTAIIITIMEESTRTAPNRTESTLPSFRFRYRVIERKLFLFDKRIQSCVCVCDMCVCDRRKAINEWTTATTNQRKQSDLLNRQEFVWEKKTLEQPNKNMPLSIMNYSMVYCLFWLVLSEIAELSHFFQSLSVIIQLINWLCFFFFELRKWNKNVFDRFSFAMKRVDINSVNGETMYQLALIQFSKHSVIYRVRAICLLHRKKVGVFLDNLNK